MAYDPKLDWDEDYPNTPEDMNRIEGNIKNLKSETTTIDGEKTFSQNINAPSINTGHGDNELYAMDQDVKTTDAVTFASVDTGQGANELYDMDQDVKTTDNVTFNKQTLTVGRIPSGSYSQTGTVTEDEVFDGVKNAVPNIGDKLICSGGRDFRGVDYTAIIFHYFERTSSTVITFGTASGSTETATDGDTSTFSAFGIGISW